MTAPINSMHNTTVDSSGNCTRRHIKQIKQTTMMKIQ